MILRQKRTGDTLLTALRPCDTFMCKLRGLMFRRSLDAGEGLLFIYKRESRLDTAIHMFFMRFSIAVVWLDAERRVVDTCLALPWRPSYAPAHAARYTIEAAPALLNRVNIGDRLEW